MLGLCPRHSGTLERFRSDSGESLFLVSVQSVDSRLHISYKKLTYCGTLRENVNSSQGSSILSGDRRKLQENRGSSGKSSNEAAELSYSPQELGAGGEEAA